ncbi:putative inhibitor of apoptosis [Mytilus californianus]|uniref:putative inhibitor of apoptosis n=1 Tax=Mytilus californianus TaxID=6549 RepID=UPI0022471ED2|nr:putative inhibitor of apoptosis [Mytilus californianus]
MGDDVYKRKKLTITKQKECVAQNRNELCTGWTDLQYFSKTEIGRRKISLSPILTVLFIIFLLKRTTESFKARTRIKLKTKETTKKKAPGILQLKSGWIFDNIIKPWRCFPRNVYHAYPFLPQETSLHFKNGRQISASANMQFEGARFATFASFPHVPGIFATRLAEAGFYYSGSGNEVVCFSCGVRYSSWRHHDSAFEIHKRISPNCPFISDEAVKRKEGNQNFDESMNNNIKEEKIYPHTSSETSFGISSSSQEQMQHYKNNKDDGSGTSQLSNPTNRIISAENVVTPGFLTSDNQSLVATPKIENKVKKSELNATGNVLKESTSRSALRMEGTSSSELLEIGVCLDKAKYPKYGIRSNRIDSFKHWPSYLTQTPEEMATAGFFFTGIEDHCRCFFCGGGLRNWEPDDKPWTEHAHWYPNCAFVRQSKGQKIIDEMQSNGYQPILQESEELNACRRRPDLTTTGKEHVAIDFSIHPAVLSVSEFGYSECVVKKAYDLLHTARTKVITGTTLLEAIFEMEEKTTKDRSNDTLKIGQAEQTEQIGRNEIPIEKQETTVDLELELSIRSLEEENQNLKDQQTCKICLDKPISIVFLPCGHMASCANCAPALRRCPICRVFIKGTVKAIMC